MSEWRPIETAPKDGTPILGWPVWGGKNEGAEIYWQPMRRTPGRWAIPFGPPSPRGPILWQPLPAPPTATVKSPNTGITHEQEAYRAEPVSQTQNAPPHMLWVPPEIEDKD